MFQGKMRIVQHSFNRTAILAALFACCTGCQQLASYPPVEVTSKLQRPAAEPVPTIIAQTIVYARQTYGVQEQLSINLPEGMPATVYEKVFAHLGGGQPMQHAGEQAIHITSIRTRGTTAQVDLIYPTPTGFYGFCTIDLARHVFEDWHVTEERQWTLRNAAPPGPNYVPGPPA